MIGSILLTDTFFGDKFEITETILIKFCNFIELKTTRNVYKGTSETLQKKKTDNRNIFEGGETKWQFKKKTDPRSKTKL